MFLSLKSSLGRQFLSSFTGLLDSFGGASAAYSLRRLSSSYDGHALRVRRSTDNVEVDVGFNGGSVSSTSPITNVDDEPAVALSLGTSWSKITGSAGSETLSPAGSLNIGGTYSTPYRVKLSMGETVASGSTVAFSGYVSTVTGSNWRVYPAQSDNSIATGGSAVTLSSTGSFNVSFLLNADAVSFVIENSSGTENFQLSFGVAGSKSVGDTAATTLGAFIAEASSPDLLVDTWYDQTGNGRHGVQPTAANQPSLALSGTLRDNLFFDGSNDSLSVNSTVSTSIPFGDGTVAAVHKSESAGRKSSYIYNGATNSSPRHLIGSNSSGNFLIYRGASASGSEQDTNLNNYIGIFDNSGAVNVGQLYVRGSPVATTTSMTTAAFDSDTMSIGNYGGLHDNLYELILWSDPDVGTNNRTAIDADVETYYGIS